MVNFKKIGISLIAAPLTLGILAPSISATQLENNHSEKIEIRVASTENVVSKNELIKRFKELFPKQFDFLSNSDFHMNGGHRFPDDDRIRYDLNFFKTMDGKEIHGGVGFVGEDLEIESFYFEPANTAEALFPAKITKSEAEKIAVAFIGQFLEKDEYQLDTNFSSYPFNQTLTQPIRYTFSFVKMKNDVPVSDQRVEVVVLGNGEVVNFYRSTPPSDSPTFDEVTNIQDENSILEKIKENLSLTLQYQIDYDYRTNERDVHLVYKPSGQFIGVNALSGDWQTVKGFTTELPKENNIDLIVDEPLPARQEGISLEEAKSLAEDLLAIDSEDVTLTIESIEEMENSFGQEVISIQYMYQYQNGGYGTNLVLDKNTGDIIQYHDIKSDVLRQVGDKGNAAEISREKALEKAIEYLKEYAPSYLHNYSMPINDEVFYHDRGVYYFTFPRVVNGIAVSGDQISISVTSDGALMSLNADHQKVENWPNSSQIISKEEAKEKFMDSLGLKLQYMKAETEKKEDHYSLVYTPEFNDELYSLLDANSGEWINRNGHDSDSAEISHPWAAVSLNYLLNAKVLVVDNPESFDANQTITKGKAIELIMKSLTYIYVGDIPRSEGMTQTFDNISPEHPLYQVVERAVQMGILDSSKGQFDFNAPLTREELAVWYIRALDLEDAAKYPDIYQLSFEDLEDIEAKNKGYVALATSIGLLSASQNHFYPDKEVSYAELAVSTIRLAHEAFEKGVRMY